MSGASARAGVAGTERRARPYLLVGGVWLVVQAGLFLALGVQHGGDTPRYLSAAERLLAGSFPAGKATSYLGYDLFVAGITGVGLGQLGVVVGQCLFALVAALCLYAITEAAYGARAALFAGVLMAAWPDLQRWNFYLLTDSLFVSAGVIAAWCVLDPRALRWPRWLAPLAVAFATLVRPNGVCILAAALGVLAQLWWRAGRITTLAASGLVFAVALPFLLQAVNGMLGHERVIDIYTKGEVIWGYEAQRHVFTGSAAATGARQGLGEIAMFALSYPGYFLALFGSKLSQLYAHTRPFYSEFHNLLLLATLIPLYALALRGLVRPSRLAGAKTFFVILALAQTLVIGLTFADWDGRDLLIVLPVVFLFAGPGLASPRRAAGTREAGGAQAPGRERGTAWRARGR